MDQFCPVRPERLTVRPWGEGRFAIDVRWRGRESVLRAVFVRRLLAQAGVEAHPASSEGGRVWDLRLGPVAGDRVGELIDSFIW